jgi:hypothetical protein
VVEPAAQSWPDSFGQRDWPSFRAHAFAILDDVPGHIEGLLGEPVWLPMEPRDRATFVGTCHAAPPRWPRCFANEVSPLSVGNLHPTDHPHR